VTAASLVADLARIAQVQARLSAGVSMLMALIALIAVLPVTWPVTRHLQVMAHEGAHATMNSALGVRLTGIELLRTGEGATHHGPRGPLESFLALLVGYLGPSLFGVGAAELISAGHIVAVLWIAVGMLLVFLFLLRRGFGLLTVLVALVTLFLVAVLGSVGTQVVVAYALAWFLLMSGFRMITIHGANSGDASALRDLTKIPRAFWFLVWLIGTVAGLVFGGILLV